MRTILFALSMLMASSSFAAQQICMNSKNRTLGYFQVEVTPKKLYILAGKGKYAEDAAFKISHISSVTEKDGRTYLRFDTVGAAGSDTLLADKALLLNNGSGNIKFRAHSGEGYQDTIFYCRDVGFRAPNRFLK